MRILLAGATGVIGRSLAPMLVEAGHRVTALTRSPARAPALEASGLQARVCDIFDRDALAAAFAAASPEVVVHQLTSLPRRIDPRHLDRDLAATNRLRVEGTRNLVEAAQHAGARRLIAQSVAFAYAPGAPTPAREEDPLYLAAPASFRPVIEAVDALERTTLGAEGLEGVALRHGQLYGPETAYAPDGSIAEDVRRRRMPILGQGTGCFSFLHVEDAAGAVLSALSGSPPGVYNIVDDDPVTVRDWLPWYAAKLGARPPMHLPGWLGRWAGGAYVDHLMNHLRGASNAEARRRLGWSPRYPTWRDRMLATSSGQRD